VSTGQGCRDPLCQNSWMRILLSAFLVLVAVACGGGQPEAGMTIAEHAALLRASWVQGRDEVGHRLHRLRNVQAILDLGGALQPDRKQMTMLYLAAGDHVAPLGLCENLSEGVPCRLIMTEVDAGVQEGIAEALEDLESAGCIWALTSGPKIEGPNGTRMWTGKLGPRSFSVELRVTDPDRATPLVTPEMIEGVDLVISHDWSGEPLGNLQVIWWYLQAARENPQAPPPLMIEDLRKHPYETDVGPFVPVATTEAPYGHRASDAGPGRHGRVELGTQIFGGAVLLTFDDPWWRLLSDQQLESVFDFLLLNQFDIDRQNVLEGGADPLLAPMLLDWWTGYGARGVNGEAITPGRGGTRERMIEAAIVARECAGSKITEIFTNRLELYHSLLALRAQGVDTLDLMPSARYQRRPAPGGFPSMEMERLFRQALRRIGMMRSERRVFGEEAVVLLAGFPQNFVSEPSEGGDMDLLRRRYRQCARKVHGRIGINAAD